MADIIGPIFIIALVFVIYHFAGKMDIASEVKKSNLELSKIDAETRKEEIRIESKRLDLQLGKMVIDARKLRLDTKDAEAEYKSLEDKHEK